MLKKLNPFLRVIRTILCIGFLFTCKDLIAQDIQPPGFTLDFEQGNLRGWESSGQAFANQPTLGDNPIAGGRNQSANQQGRYWIGTFENYQGQQGQQQGTIQGNPPTGILTSESFIIPEGTLSFLIGGSSSFETRVALYMLDQIEGRIRVEYATGQGSETMERVEWDLSEYAGRRGQIQIIDESTNGHINVDDFNFSYFFNLTQPTVELMVTNKTVRVGGSTVFAAMLDPGYDAASYNFHFGNGEETGWSRNPRVSHTYNSPGSYEAFVEVNPNPDLNNIRSESIPIEVTLPEADLYLRANKTDVMINETIQFSGGTDNDSLDLVIYYGDDNAANFNGPTVEHSYPQPGTYTVQLSAYLSNRPVGSESVTINVGASTLELDASDLLTKIDEPVSFSAKLDPPNTSYSYEFNLGDDTSNGLVTSPEIEHRFSDPGKYLVYAVARNLNSEVSISSNSLLVTVVEIALTADKSIVGMGEQVQFTGSLNPSLDNATYDFIVGDSTFSRSQPEFEYAFLQAGEYEVTFIASVNGRIVFSDPYSITVNSDLNLTLELDSHDSGTGNVIQFTALGLPSGAGADYNFHFGDGEESGWQANAEASYSYDEEGAYDTFVEARLSSNQTIQSGIQRINIGVGGLPDWILIVAGLVVLGIAGYLIVFGRMLQGSGDGSITTGTATTAIKPHIDSGKQEIASVTQFVLGTEIRLKPVKDIGEQFIGNADNLIIKER